VVIFCCRTGPGAFRQRGLFSVEAWRDFSDTGGEILIVRERIFFLAQRTHDESKSPQGVSCRHEAPARPCGILVKKEGAGGPRKDASGSSLDDFERDGSASIYRRIP